MGNNVIVVFFNVKQKIGYIRYCWHFEKAIANSCAQHLQIHNLNQILFLQKAYVFC